MPVLDRVETDLARRLKARIREDGPVTFRDFMDAALYDPELGYYTRGPAIGTDDAAFSTSAKHAAFAFAFANAVRQADARVGGRVRIVEFGGGTGVFAERVLDALGEADREYVIVDASAGLRAKQRSRGVTTVPDATTLDPAPTLAFGNEVLDAFPVHRVAQGPDGTLHEVHVGLNSRGDFVERLGPVSTPDITARLAAEDVALQPGQVAEVNLALDGFLAQAARLVDPGYLVLVDYGDDAPALYAPQKLNGTLRTYRGQQPTYDVFDHVGEADITADVDFTAVTRAATHAGLEDAGRADQGGWLLSLGIRAYDGEDAMDQVTWLTDPSTLGHRFHVLTFKTRGLPDAPGFVWE